MQRDQSMMRTSKLSLSHEMESYMTESQLALCIHDNNRTMETVQKCSRSTNTWMSFQWMDHYTPLNGKVAEGPLHNHRKEVVKSTSRMSSSAAQKRGHSRSESCSPEDSLESCSTIGQQIQARCTTTKFCSNEVRGTMNFSPCAGQKADWSWQVGRPV